MKAAAVSWKIRPCHKAQDFWNHFEEVVLKAADQGAELLVLPELITLELEGLFDHPADRPQDRMPLLADDLQLKAHLSNQHGLTIVAGSALVMESGDWVNRSLIFWPSGRVSFQDKIVMTQFEKVEWGVTGGASLEKQPDPRIGVLVCYDSEFPELGRSLAERGVLALCVPSYTETWHGHWRVRHSCHARAVENQVFVLHAPLVGSLGREPVPESHGTAGILAPCCLPFPSNGVLAEGPQDEEAIITAELDFEALLAARETGDVRNWQDREQVRRFVP